MMRQFLRRKLCLSSRVLVRPNALALVLGAGELHGLAAPDGSAVAGAVDLTLVAGVTNADFERAARAAEETMAVDHLSPGR
jgi:alkanesulfonate monooxygenase SsuD/methylene tetrahydromethanopterin reductase-like flavin-dependent oxidoreductase (luciferase family)